MRKVLCLLFLLLFAIYQSALTHAESCSDTKKLSFAVWMPYKANSTKLYSQPVVKQLEKDIGLPIEFLIIPSIDVLVHKLNREEIDIAFLGSKAYIKSREVNPNIAAFASFSEQSEPTVIQHYRSLLISLKGRQLDTIESLKDHPIALVSPGSITGHTAPIMLFSKHINSSLDDYFSEIIFSGQHHLSVIAVTKGNVDAAFIASTVLAASTKELGVDTSQLNILWRSPPIPFAPIVLRTSLCEKWRNSIQQAFLSIGDHPESSDWLSLFNASAVIATTDQNYDVTRQIHDLSNK